MSGETATMSCSVGNSCTQTDQFTSSFIPTNIALIPLLFGIIAGIGLVVNRLLLSWIGTILLLVFSFIGMLSIGFFYLPLSIILLAFIAFMHGHRQIDFRNKV
jgi:hypothetical protein